MPRMTAASEGFADWACDPHRTLEERFSAELLIEQTLGLWRVKHGIKVETNYEAERLRRNRVSLTDRHLHRDTKGFPPSKTVFNMKYKYSLLFALGLATDEHVIRHESHGKFKFAGGAAHPVKPGSLRTG